MQRIHSAQIACHPAIALLEAAHPRLPGVEPEPVDERCSMPHYMRRQQRRFVAAALAWIAGALGHRGTPPGGQPHTCASTLEAAGRGDPWMRSPRLAHRDLLAAPEAAVREDLLPRLLAAPHRFPGSPGGKAAGDDPPRYRLLLLRFKRLPVCRAGQLSGRAALRPLHAQALLCARVAEAALGYRPRVAALGRSVDHACRSRPAHPARADHVEALIPAGEDDADPRARAWLEGQLEQLRALRRGDHPPRWPPAGPLPTPGQHPRWAAALRAAAAAPAPPALGGAAPAPAHHGQVACIDASSRELEWLARPPVEHFVDFETVQGVHDSFAAFPRMESRPLIAVIGVLTACRDLGTATFRSFVVRRLDPAEEARIADEFVAHLEAAEARARPAAPAAPAPLLHWSAAEPIWWSAALARRGEGAPAAGPRHRSLEWTDLLPAFRRHLAVSGSGGAGLKQVAGALRRGGHLPADTVLALDAASRRSAPVEDGASAQAALLWCEEARRRAAPGATLRDSDPALVDTVIEYNRLDCQLTHDIVQHTRKTLHARPK